MTHVLYSPADDALVFGATWAAISTAAFSFSGIEHDRFCRDAAATLPRVPDQITFAHFQRSPRLLLQGLSRRFLSATLCGL